MPRYRFQIKLWSRLQQFASLPGILTRRHDPELAVRIPDDPALRVPIDEQAYTLLTDSDHVELSTPLSVLVPGTPSTAMTRRNATADPFRPKVAILFKVRRGSQVRATASREVFDQTVTQRRAFQDPHSSVAHN